MVIDDELTTGLQVDVPCVRRIALCPVALVQAPGMAQPAEGDGYPDHNGDREEFEFPRRIRYDLCLLVPLPVTPGS
jgi:hypothetical protein